MWLGARGCVLDGGSCLHYALGAVNCCGYHKKWLVAREELVTGGMPLDASGRFWSVDHRPARTQRPFNVEVSAAEPSTSASSVFSLLGILYRVCQLL